MSNLPGDVVGGNTASDVGKIPGDVVNLGAQSNAFAEFVRSQEFAAILQEQYRTNWGAPVPVGGIVPFAGTAAPTDWLVCDGTSYARSLYPDLAAILVPGTFGGDTSSFVVPDLRGRTVVGGGNDASAANNDARTLGAKGGDTRMPTHKHTISDPGHKHTSYFPGSSGGGYGVYTFNGSSAPVGVDTSTNGTGITATNDEGSGGSGNMPPFYVLNYIVRAR